MEQASSKGITPYQTKKGPRFLAQVRVKGHKPESQSFGSRPEALAWKNKREVELSGQAPERECGVPQSLLMGDIHDANGNVIEKGLFTMYTEMHPNLPSYQVLQFNRLKAHSVLKGVRVADMCFSVILAYCKARKAEGVSPSTTQTEVARISVSIRGVADDQAWDENYIHPLTGARARLKKLKLIAESNERTRRPTGPEMDALAAYFAEKGGDIPMADIAEFAALNAFRRGELVALRWSDLDVEGSQIACARKDSSALENGKRGTLVPLRAKALQIVLRQPRVEGEDRIFPFNGDTVGGLFADACKALNKLHGGKFCLDLHFHDLRHEAISVASQIQGLTTAQLKTFSGHKNERHLSRYIKHTREDIANTARLMQ
jgi:integrase